jgi:glycosyl transferase, family 25
MLKIYIISLKGSRERRDLMSRQMKKLKLPFTFLDAIEGSKLTKESLEGLYKEGEYFRPLKTGEIACTLSHCEVYKQMILHNDPFALVMEDDVLLSDDLPVLLAGLPLEEDCALMLFNILLGSCDYKNETPLTSDYFLTVPSNIRSIYGTQAYIVSQSTAKKLLHFVLPVRNTPDDWLWFKNAGTFSSLKVVFPFPIVHAEFLSDIHVESLFLSGSIYNKVKSFVYTHKVPLLYHLFMFKRRQHAEKVRRNFATLDGLPVRKTFKL